MTFPRLSVLLYITILTSLLFSLNYPLHQLSLLSELAPHPYELQVATGHFPVLNDSEAVRFENLPIGNLRPANQFSTNPFSFRIYFQSEPPVLTVITVTRNARMHFLQTATFMQTQSLRPLRWVIVNDYTDSKTSLDTLKKVEAMDTRFFLLNNTYPPGFSTGRNFALDYLLSSPTEYFLYLDDDDMFELTALEKCAWMLESNRNVSLCGSYVVGFGETNYTWRQGFHNGHKIISENPLTGSEMMRTDILTSSGCRFDEELTTGMEDWEFYLCVASSGRWGATVPELLYWYRQNAKSIREERWQSLFTKKEETTSLIQGRYAGLEENFPVISIPSTTPFEKMNFTSPFRNVLKTGKNILFIIPWMAIGGADTANLAIVKDLSERGYRVTIICTLLNVLSVSMRLQPLFMQYTHDIFSLPAMLRLADVPRFLAYIVESRGIELVLLSNSQLGYGILPWLASKHPDLVFIDYVHNEEPQWKDGGYASFSTLHQLSLDFTFTSSQTAREFMIKHGHDPSTIDVGYLGIDLEDLQPLLPVDKLVQREALGIPLQATVVIFLARMVPHKQPRVVFEAFINAIQAIQKEEGGPLPDKNRFMLLLAGDGQMRQEVERLSALQGGRVRMLGHLEHKQTIEYLAVSDIFCLPSTSEGISFALAEAMALGLVPLTSNVGGSSEILGENREFGITLNVTGDIQEDSKVFTGPLKGLLLQRKWREEIGEVAVQRVHAMFNAKTRIPRLVSRILATKRRRKVDVGDVSALATFHYAQNSVLRELAVFSEYPAIYNALKGKSRGPYGSRYRATCGEFDDVNSRLIDMLESPKACVNGTDLKVAKLRSNALEQCGRWCILNFDDPKLQSGWHVREKCGGIETFDSDDHKCVKWFRALPSK